MATRGDWKLRANSCRGASWSDERFWSQQLDGNSAKRTPAVWRSSDFKDTRPPISIYMVCWKVYSCAAVGSTVTCHVTILCV